MVPTQMIARTELFSVNFFAINHKSRCSEKWPCFVYCCCFSCSKFFGNEKKETNNKIHIMKEFNSHRISLKHHTIKRRDDITSQIMKENERKKNNNNRPASVDPGFQSDGRYKIENNLIGVTAVAFDTDLPQTRPNFRWFFYKMGAENFVYFTLVIIIFAMKLNCPSLTTQYCHSTTQNRLP